MQFAVEEAVFKMKAITLACSPWETETLRWGSCQSNRCLSLPHPLLAARLPNQDCDRAAGLGKGVLSG